GAEDDRTGFQPAHPLLAEMDRRYRHLRIGRSGRVFEALVPAVLEQKVVGAEARRAWRLLMLRFGEAPPGPAPRGMRVFPPPRSWARIPSWEWHRAGVEGVRARTVIGAAHVAGRLEEIVRMTPAEADLRLRSLPGIGPWTSAETRIRGHRNQGGQGESQGIPQLECRYERCARPPHAVPRTGATHTAGERRSSRARPRQGRQDAGPRRGGHPDACPRRAPRLAA